MNICQSYGVNLWGRHWPRAAGLQEESSSKIGGVWRIPCWVGGFWTLNGLVLQCVIKTQEVWLLFLHWRTASKQRCILLWRLDQSCRLVDPTLQWNIGHDLNHGDLCLVALGSGPFWAQLIGVSVYVCAVLCAADGTIEVAISITIIAGSILYKTDDRIHRQLANRILTFHQTLKTTCQSTWVHKGSPCGAVAIDHTYTSTGKATWKTYR